MPGMIRPSNNASMAADLIIYNARIVNEGRIFNGSVLVKAGQITEVHEDSPGNNTLESYPAMQRLDAKGKYLIPGVIDDQVHFREPGLTHKGDLFTESRAAAAGGITSFMEMPNTSPPALSMDLLEAKYELAASKSLVNFSFFMGASNDNLSEIRKVNPKDVCGVKVFMGASTGNLLVDDPRALEGIFAESPALVAVHAEEESIIRANLHAYQQRYGEAIPVEAHPLIRSREACIQSTAKAIALALKYNTRLHVLHLSTAEEVGLFDNATPLTQKRITAEVCVHHLWFNATDYARLGNFIKWNPAIKEESDSLALLEGLKKKYIDLIATDHAPHTLEEKQRPYGQAPSGGPLVQHALPAMMEFVRQQKISLPELIQYMCHAPALAYHLEGRGFIRPGYRADLVLLDDQVEWAVKDQPIHYKCGWSPFRDHIFHTAVTHTFVNGNLVFEQGVFHEGSRGERLKFDR